MPFQQAGTISLNGRLAGVSGSPAVLGALTLSQSGIGNLDAGNGGFIGHTVFDLSPAGNPAGLTNNALHTFGVSANFSGGQIEPSIAIGSGSNSPWMGLGGDRVAGDVHLPFPKRRSAAARTIFDDSWAAPSTR